MMPIERNFVKITEIVFSFNREENIIIVSV
jgi:hypothetical protein